MGLMVAQHGEQPYAKNIIHAARIAITSRTSDAAAKRANLIAGERNQLYLLLRAAA
jgi:hypothetical protein